MIKDEIAELSCNIDDMTGEDIGYASEILMKNGALDVFTAAIQMKKNRPAVMLSCLTRIGDADFMAELILKHTSTIGVRRKVYDRYKMERTEGIIDSPYGKIRYKRSHGYGAEKIKFEHDDMIAACKESGLTLAELRRIVGKLIEV